MKKKIKKVVGFALFMLVYGCSSGQYAVDKEITLDELTKLEGKSSVLKVTTKDTLYDNVSGWETRDSSLTFPDYGKNYAERISGYRAKRIGALEEHQNQKILYNNYPKPDTLLIPFKSINKIEYSGKLKEESKSDRDLPPRGGIEINGRQKELTLALHMEGQVDFYRMVVKINTSFLFGSDKTQISTSGLYSLGYMFAGGLALGTIHTEDVGKSGKMIYTIILGLPLLLTNAEHHIFLLNAPGPEQTKPVALSTFVSFRTDYFDNKELVYTPGAGIQFEFNFPDDKGGRFGNSLGLKLGTEFPFDLVSDKTADAKIFLAAKVTY